MAVKKESKKKIVPLGKPLALTKADLERLSVVTPADIEAAKATWRAQRVAAEYQTIDSRKTDSRPARIAFFCRGVASCCCVVTGVDVCGRLGFCCFRCMAGMESDWRGATLC